MADPVVISKDRMGSPFTIKAYPDERMQTRERLEQFVELAFAEIDRVEDLLTDFRPSPFNEINENAGIRPVKVPQEVLGLIEFGQQVAECSGGAFDISYAAVGMLWREAFNKGTPPEPEEIERAKRLVNYRRIEVNAGCSEVFLPEKGMRIGLGSIGKSHGVDMAYTLLRTLGVKNFFVDGAGDLRVHAAASAPHPWRIGIKNPFRGDAAPCAVLHVALGAVATSGNYERYMDFKGKRYHHIIDARTAQIRSDVSSVTVLAPTAVTANAYATAVMALGAADGAEFLSRRSSAKGLIITPEGTINHCNMEQNSAILDTGGLANVSN